MTLKYAQQSWLITALSLNLPDRWQPHSVLDSDIGIVRVGILLDEIQGGLVTKCGYFY